MGLDSRSNVTAIRQEPAVHPELALLDALPSAVLVLAMGSGRIEFSNRRAAEALETTSGALEGRDVSTVLAPVEWLVARKDMPQPDRVLDVALPSGRHIVAGYSVS
jgi:PAS domain-containing protein